MVKSSLSNFFDDYLKKESIFKDKKVLQLNYTPSLISHRDDQISQIAHILAPTLKLEKPSNLFIYGKTGTGKTVSIKHITKQMQETALKNNIPLKMVYINCKLKKIADTEYRVLAHLAREFGKEIPSTGLPTDDVYKIFYSALDKEKLYFVLILDEIDQLVNKTSDQILYNLTRINEELKNSQISFIGISNDLVFIDNLDPRVRSSLSEEEILFPPYNALQIQSILKERVKEAFKEDSIPSGVIEKCAALAARDHGDARRALELLRVSGELAERDGSSKVELKYLDIAEDKIERDRIKESVVFQPKQFQTVLYSIIKIAEQKKEMIFTGEIYELYSKLCKKIGISPLTQRRVSDILAELDMLGIINAKVISKGRYGRTREISLSLNPNTTENVKSALDECLGLS